jgi:dTDP-4-amino-4,6-dideoxygalactose transaminase
MRIPLASTGLRSKDIQLAIQVLKSGNLTMGPMVKEFESKYNLKLETYKQESTDPGRLYFVYTKQ